MNSRTTGLARLQELRYATGEAGERILSNSNRFRSLAGDNARPRVVSSFNLFQTPPDLAEQLAGMFLRWGRTLEPSAGLGRLYKAAREQHDGEIVLIDISPDCCRELFEATARDQTARIIQGDFLMQSRETIGEFDSVIMNPPFKNGIDIKHIRHAASLLNAGGRLVSLCYNGPRQQRYFRDECGYEYHELPAGTFRSEGTNAETAIVVIDR